MTAVYILLLSLCASFIQRTIGFGFGIFIMTMLPLLTPSYGEATALSGMMAMTTSLITSVKMRRFITWKRMLPILAVFTVVSTLCIFFVSRMEDHLLKRIMGAVLILTSLYFAFFSKRIRLRPTLPVQIGTGTLSGAMGGFFGMQGPPAVLYFISSEPDKEHYIAMCQCYFFIGNLLMTLARGANGFVTATVLTDYLYGLGGVLIGTMIGDYVFKFLSGNLLRYLVYVYIGISGVVALFTA